MPKELNKEALWAANKAFLVRHRPVEIELEIDDEVFEKIKAAAEIEDITVQP